MLIGEVVEISADENIKPLIYHKYIEWPNAQNVEQILNLAAMIQKN